MTLRRKTVLTVSLMLVGLIALLFVVLYGIMSDTFATLDRQSTLRNLDRATNTLRDSVFDLDRAVHDWSSWDDTYQFALDANTAYIDANLNDDTFWDLNVHLMVFLNSANEVIFSKALDIHPGWQNSILDDFEDYIERNETFLRLTTSVPTSGFVLIGGEPLLLATRPILHNDETGPKAGTLMWAQHLAPEELLVVGRSLRLSIDLFDAAAPDLSEDARDAQAQLSPTLLRATAPLNEVTIAGYTYLSDIYGQPSLLLRSTQERSAYQEGQSSLLVMLGVLVIAGVVFAVVLLLLLERLFLSRLMLIVEGLRDALRSDDFSQRLPVNGQGELAQFANGINAMMMTVSQLRDEALQSNTQLQVMGDKQAAEMERQKANLQSIIDAMGEGLVYCVNGRISFVNRAFVEMLYYEQEELVGKSFALLNQQLDPSETPIYFTSPRRYEATLTRRDGTNIDAAIISAPVDHGEKQHSQVIIVRDITQELAIKREKDFFFARASHDLRAPLTSIITRLYLLSKRPEQLDTHLKILNDVSNQMLDLVNDLLDVSRFERGTNSLKRRDLVLQSLVDQVVEVQQADAEMKKIELVAQADETPLHVYADPTRLTQVITNLVSNALHYTPAGGRIVVEVEQAYDEGEKYALVNVTDTGVGIDGEHLVHIFDPFFRLSSENAGGSGLGLFIVREIVELHGGEVRVSSEVGKGTTFSVRLALRGASSLSETVSSKSPNLA